MTGLVVAVVALAVINIVYKGIGPAVLGDRVFPPRIQEVIDALPAALLAGLVSSTCSASGGARPTRRCCPDSRRHPWRGGSACRSSAAS